ncbi:MAG: hypothetical protein WC071_01430 [Victivallaceae bacterium]
MTKKNIKDIYSLAETLKNIQEQADKLGIFTENRELLECEKCGLLEDYTFKHGLITYVAANCTGGKLKDSGLRFKATDNPSQFICPQCGNSIKLPDENIND